MSRSRGAGAIVRALEDEGVPFAFGIPGTHNLELWDRLADSAVEPVLVTDERCGAFMADGLWRASGRLGCLALVPGAGLAHALSGIAEAWLDHVPLLVLACGVRRDTDRAFQLHEVDQVAIARPVTKAVLRAGRGADLYPLVRRACVLARAGAPGPVLVETPVDLLLHPGRDPAGAPPADLPAPPPSPPLEAAEVRRAAGILAEARRPILYLGHGARGGGDLWVRLAERLDAPVATTLQGKGVFPESHPLWLWPGLGRIAPRFVRSIGRRADAMLAVGCRFAEVGTGSWSFEPPAELVHVDIDPAALGRNAEARVAVVADALRFGEALLEALGPRSGPPDASLRTRIRDGHREEAAARAGDGDAGVDPAILLPALQAALDPDTVWATDSGNGTFLAAELLRLDTPGRFLAPVDFSCMGYSVPAAIGAALGGRGRPAVALAGDGAFLMTGLEMLTAGRHGLPVAFVVLRDRELAQIAQFQRTAYGRSVCAELPDFDVLALARGAGIPGLRVEGNAEVPGAVRAVADSLAGGRPIAVDVRIDYGRPSHFTRGVVRTNFLRLPWIDRLRFVARALARRLG